MAGRGRACLKIKLKISRIKFITPSDYKEVVSEASASMQDVAPLEGQEADAQHWPSKFDVERYPSRQFLVVESDLHNGWKQLLYQPILGDNRLAFLDWICPVCEINIDITKSGRGICQKCGLLVREPKREILQEFGNKRLRNAIYAEWVRNGYKDWIEEEEDGGFYRQTTERESTSH